MNIKNMINYIPNLITKREIALKAKADYKSYRWLLMSTSNRHGIDIFLQAVNISVKIYNTNKFWFQKKLPTHIYKG